VRRPDRPLVAFRVIFGVAIALLAVNASAAVVPPAPAPAPTWIANGRLTPQAVSLLTQLSQVERRGLIRADYDSDRLAQLALSVGRADRSDPSLLAGFDVSLSAAAARLVSDLHRGRVDPAHVGHDLVVERDGLDVAGAVATLATSKDIGATLDSFEPPMPHYRLLKKALARYQELARDPLLTQLPPLPARAVRVDESYEGMPALRRLLVAVGDLDEPGTGADESENVLDSSSVAALRRFQTRHGLDADGILGRTTFRALTTPMSLRAEQIALSMERTRWLPHRMDSPAIFVNVPQFRLFAFRHTGYDARDLLRMDVIVGESFEGRQTPVFAADMRYVVLQPYWDVPYSILRKELLPQIQRDPDWIERNGYEIATGPGDDSGVAAAKPENLRLLAAGNLRLRQRPGPDNALGRVKFMFPNRHNVYLHDTPARSLFALTRRAFSHGCIRVSDPMALLAHVLRNEPEWDEARIAAAFGGPGPVRIPLSQPIRVYILYATAIATEAGGTFFFEDIYNHDSRLIGLLGSRRSQ
jgi:murein L,D-transpeptidase YcbB/YkuD